MILLIDNFDSFTYNVYQYLRNLGRDVTVKRNNAISIEEIETMAPTHIVISPGPGRPEDAGVSVDVIKHFAGVIPILGICLGHQCIGYAFGGKIVKAAEIMHGKISEVIHDEKGIFSRVKNPFKAVRYHSLVIDKSTLPEELEVSASVVDGDIMAVRHKRYSLVGVQFHPESIGSEFGFRLLENFLDNAPEPLFIKSAIARVSAGGGLSEAEAEKVMDEISSGVASPGSIGAMLMALSLKGETVDEIAGFARVMRRKAVPIGRVEGVELVDTCGTGGDGSHTFNISTTAAFVAAGAGVPVAKHGNRSITSRCGSADVLEGLGVNLAVGPEVVEAALVDAGFAFLFAPKLHLSMKHAGPVRRDIGVRTVFNILGPLSNPAGADYQVIGVFSEHLLEKVAKVLVRLGVKRALVVHGRDGLDEITLTGVTRVFEVRDGWIRDYEIDPADYGFAYCDAEALKGGDLRVNCEIVLDVLQGKPGPCRDIVVLNAAAAIYVSGKAEDFKSAITLARESIDGGAAMKKLESLIQSTGGPANAFGGISI